MSLLLSPDDGAVAGHTRSSDYDDLRSLCDAHNLNDMENGH